MIYSSVSYLSLLLGYTISPQTEHFFDALTGTDKIILTFIIGAVILLLIVFTSSLPHGITKYSAADSRSLFVQVFLYVLLSGVGIATIRIHSRLHYVPNFEQPSLLHGIEARFG